MEDEEGYMALKIRPRQHYRQSPQPQNHETVSHHCRCCQIIAGVGGAVILLLVGAALAGICVFQLCGCNLEDAPEKGLVFQRSSNETEDNSRLDTVTKLRTFFCKPLDGSATECRLCPVNWLPHKSKCYWIAKEKQSWHKSQEDCREKHAQMLVIKSQEEQSFIWKMISEGKKLPWLGLKTTSSGGNWSWIDGSPLNDTMLQSLGIAEPNSCGMLKNNQITSQACGALAEWICETGALLV
uniref:Killer cell lectin-like receptor subfamily F member 1 isoform X1 n=1 Tax=Pogona vitticeps TaxID=103695 RepID=A0A6J0V960_9SAUR